MCGKTIIIPQRYVTVTNAVQSRDRIRSLTVAASHGSPADISPYL